MNVRSYNLAGVFFTASMAVAAADDQVLRTGQMAAVSVATLEEQQFRNFVLEETVLADRSTIRGRAYVDDVLGVTCEWLERGRSEADTEGRFHIVNRKPEAVGCVTSTKLPERWDRGELSDFDVSGMVYQDKSRLGIVHELIEAQSLDEAVVIKREWNASTQQVCLRTMAVAINDEGEYGEPFSHSWGCFDVKDKEYFNNVMDGAGFRPA